MIMKFKFYVSIVEIFYPMAILMRVVPQQENASEYEYEYEYGQLGNVISFIFVFYFPLLLFRAHSLRFIPLPRVFGAL